VQKYFDLPIGLAIAVLISATAFMAELPAPLLDRTVENLGNALGKKNDKSVGAETDVQSVQQEINPFLAFKETADIRYHPLLGLVGAQFEGNYDFHARRDYFGFRNSFNAYFESHKYVVITGNSEAVGISHDVTIAQHLERMLRLVDDDYRVINLAMNSVSTAHEINYFVNLGFGLKPKIVISHSGATDFEIGPLMLPNFKKLGLFFTPIEGRWSQLSHAGNIDPKSKMHAAINSQGVVDGTLRNIRRYAALAEASGAKFIWGIQKVEPKNAYGTPSEESWRRVGKLFEEMKLREKDFGFPVIDFNQVAGVETNSTQDPLHTSFESARLIAGRYYQEIMKLTR